MISGVHPTQWRDSLAYYQGGYNEECCLIECDTVQPGTLVGYNVSKTLAPIYQTIRLDLHGTLHRNILFI
jgi:hypothetical protein